MSEENQAAEGAADNQKQKPTFAIKRIYVKDLSFEVPGGIKAFSFKGQPRVGQDLNTSVDRIDDNHFEVTLKVTVTVNMDEEKVAFLAEVHQAGVFQVTGYEQAQLQQVLSTACPEVLFPYVREAVDNLAVRGGFNPPALPPINFDALFVQAVMQAKQKADAEGSTEQ